MVKLTFLLAAATALTSVMAGSDASEVTKSLDIATPSDLATAPTGNLASEQAEDYIFEWEDDEEDLDEDDLDDDTSLLGEESGLLLKRQTGLACNTPGAKAPKKDILRCIARMEKRRGAAHIPGGGRTLCQAGRARVSANISLEYYKSGLSSSWKNLASTVRRVYNSCKKGSNWASGQASAKGNNRIWVSVYLVPT